MSTERISTTTADIAGKWQGLLPEQVSDMLSQALAQDASDIHIDPVGVNVYRLCFRIDGVIHSQAEMPRPAGQQLINQIKVAAQFTPDHTFGPLESRIALGGSQDAYDVRVTILPTTRREAAHLRILSPPADVLNPDELGLSEGNLSLIRQTLKRPEGLILISGATGAGKTMTLYSLASFLDLRSMIAVSIEDPVEYDLPYVRQIQADPEHGLAMAEALKTVLRMDPDIILIGEIRDAASAVTAVRAAASGRFVLATLHATDVALALEACQSFSVPRHLLGSALRLVASQALVRRVCGACAEQREPSAAEREWFRAEGLDVPDSIPRPTGCKQCHQIGYKGRTGIFEIMAFDREMATAVSGAAGTGTLRKMMAQREAPSLRQDALSKVAAGITTIEEVQDLHFPGETGDRTHAEPD